MCQHAGAYAYDAKIFGKRKKARDYQRERERERERERREIVVCMGKTLECMYVCMYVYVSSFDR
jgi:hypothetical protein